MGPHQMNKEKVWQYNWTKWWITRIMRGAFRYTRKVNLLLKLTILWIPVLTIRAIKERIRITLLIAIGLCRNRLNYWNPSELRIRMMIRITSYKKIKMSNKKMKIIRLSIRISIKSTLSQRSLQEMLIVTLKI